MKKLLLILLVLFTVKSGFAQTAAMPASEIVLKDAYAKASKENKKVMLIFHASWCGWCKKMEASLNDPSVKKMFDDNYVIATLDVMEQPAKKDLENPGSMDVMTKFHGEKSGLPFWVVLDTKGKVLADSQVRPAGALMDTYGENVGCPASPSEVAYFTNILKATSKLTDAQLAVIAKRFAQNAPAPVAKPATPAAPASVGSK
ncbi:thioredoxin family protein [Mucilaginibacter sp. 14171R-50]|uniref:thioredoxin family protein n=1 Tax=Mucilaginibacter sp. 14171R-50 TaxID=2703789 RepID=UPI00138C80BE|nr:thioredoxin family protein [Mucilaginibacter sp. 14171R-50]QHS57305.1 thioredoxin family protein [Mucilaginibacter sp. 14171R-50]